MPSKLSIYVISSHPYFINYHCLKQINGLSQKFKVTLICDVRSSGLSAHISPKVAVKARKLGRKPNIFYDLFNLFDLTRVFKFEKPDIVLSFSPKVGFLAMFAARLASVERRVHFFTGQVWATKKGISRVFYRSLEKFTAINATNVLVDSRMQAQFLVNQGIGSHGKNIVLGDGSVGGVDITRFYFNQRVRENYREKLNITDHTTVFLFLGRLTEDKGILPLLGQIKSLIESDLDVHLILAGPDEGLNIDFELSKRGLSNCTSYLGEVKNPEDVISASDVLCLISRREGFGTVIIEAASCEIPAIVSDIYGLQDSVVQDETGLVIELDNPEQLRGAMIAMCDKAHRSRLGNAARKRVETLFSSDRMTCLWLEFFEKLGEF